MKLESDPFEALVEEQGPESFAELNRRPAALTDPTIPHLTGAVTARFYGFDLGDRPLVVGLPGLGPEIVTARSTTALRVGQIGATVVIVCEEGDARRPIILGVVQERPLAGEGGSAVTDPSRNLISVQADDDQLVLSAERQIVLKCGDASITLTRAGKVLINGSYVLSRSSGYNKIKGAAVDIN